MESTRQHTIESVVQNNLCSGCGFCLAACPHHAIRMTELPAGLLYARVDETQCTDCGICQRICPSGNLDLRDIDDPFCGEFLSVWCGHIPDEKKRMLSTSGGFASAMLEILLTEKRVDAVIATGYDPGCPTRPQVRMITRPQDIYQTAGSKYCPAPLGEIFDAWLPDKRLAVVGLGCHFEALRNYCQFKRIPFDQIIKVGLICDGLMAYSAIDYLRAQTPLKAEEVREFGFRDKTRCGWPGEVMFKGNSSRHYVSGRTRKNCKSTFTPYRCRLCFDKLNIFADLILGDAWGISEDKKGRSVAAIRTETGARVFDLMREKLSLNPDAVAPGELVRTQKISRKKASYSAAVNGCRQQGLPLPAYCQQIPPNPEIEDQAMAGAMAFAYSMAGYSDRNRFMKKAAARVFWQRIFSSKPARKWQRLFKKDHPHVYTD